MLPPFCTIKFIVVARMLNYLLVSMITATYDFDQITKHSCHASNFDKNQLDYSHSIFILRYPESNIKRELWQKSAKLLSFNSHCAIQNLQSKRRISSNFKSLHIITLYFSRQKNCCTSVSILGIRVAHLNTVCI